MKRISTLVGLVAALAMAGSAAAENGGDKKKQTFTFAFESCMGISVGTYTATGALNEIGAVQALSGTFLNDDGAPVLYSIKVLRLTDGDIFLHQEGPITPTPTGFTVSGTWQLLGGTRAYVDIRGRGTEEIVGTPAPTTACPASRHVTGVYVGNIKLHGEDDRD
jgi:hypothetical protein